MLRLTVYGGVREIGGNKVLLEEGDTRLFFDFGTPFARRSRFFEEYLKPRAGAGLLDLLEMELLPPLLSLYREEFLFPELWQRFGDHPQSQELNLDGVFLSHAHLDHSGYISFLREDIPIYTTAMTAFITKAMQDSAPADFEKEVNYCIPREQREGLISAVDYKRAEGKARQRCFKFVDSPALSAAAADFWGRTPGARELCSRRFEPAGKVGSLRFHYFPVDHSIFGAAAFAVETSAGWVVYTGDLRVHGSRAALTREFIQAAARLKPTVLLCEGTHTQGQVSVREEEIYSRALQAVRSARSLVIADFGPRNVERLLIFRQVAEAANRRLTILLRDAYLLQAMRYISPEIPDLASDPVICIYEDAKAKLNRWEREIRRRYSSKLVTPGEIRAHQEEYILCFSFFDINELPSIMPREGSLYVYSSSEVYDEEGALDMRRLHHWLDHFGINKLGLPLEERHWEIPEGEQGLHASGHASGAELLSLIRSISPRILIPIHTENPEYFRESLQGTGIEVRLPQYGEEMEFG